jgi:hypothetical protein
VNIGINPNIICNAIPGAGTYVVELNTASDFSAIPITNSSATATVNFTGLAFATKYYSRVRTDLVSASTWGPTRSFTTRAASGRTSTDEPVSEETVSDESFDISLYSNPFRKKLMFTVHSASDENVTVALTDINGKTVHESVEATNVVIEVEKPITNGIYILRVRIRERYKAVRVVKMD